MGTIRYAVAGDGEEIGLYDHEGWAELWDSTHLPGVYGAKCSCGWEVDALGKPEGMSRQSADALLDELPTLQAEWDAHTDPLLAELVDRHDASRMELAELRRRYEELRAAAVRVSGAVPVSTDDLAELDASARVRLPDAWTSFAESIEGLRRVLYRERASTT